MSKLGLAIIAVVVMASLIPFVFVARSRASRSNVTALHLIHDMDVQSKKKTQSPSPVFADGRSMRPHIDGTIAREDMSLAPEILNDPAGPHLIDHNGAAIVLDSPEAFAALTLGRNRPAGMTDAEFNAARPINISNPKASDDDIATDPFYVKTIPSQIKVTSDFMHRGEERFNIYCSPCHGQSGYGDGPVNAHAQAIANAQVAGREVSWTKPQDLHDPKILSRPDGSIFNTITNGVRSMPPYDKQITILDRWAIVAYVRALQLSQNAPPANH